MKILSLITPILLLLIGCSASTGSRYETKENTENGTTAKETPVEVKEDFDISPYKTEIDIEVPPVSTDNLPPDVWYGYGNSTSENEVKVMGTAEGFRVQVLSTDNIDEANQVRAEIYERTTRKEVYIVFEPPFYKVKVGDFTLKSEAENLKFKLSQLGYSEAKVIQETVNIFE